MLPDLLRDRFCCRCHLAWARCQPQLPHAGSSLKVTLLPADVPGWAGHLCGSCAKLGKQAAGKKLMLEQCLLSLRCPQGSTKPGEREQARQLTSKHTG